MIGAAQLAPPRHFDLSAMSPLDAVDGSSTGT
jgi:hypothetical protein